MTNSCRKRVLFVFLLFTAAFAFLIWRIVKWSYVEAADLSVQADSQYYYKENITDLNYRLFDSNGKDLLTYKNRYYAVIDPYAFIKNNYGTEVDDLYALVYILRNYNDQYDLSKIGVSGNTQKIRYEIDKLTYDKLQNIKGVKGFYTYSLAEADRSEKWKLENLLTDTMCPDGSAHKDNNSLEMTVAKRIQENKNQLPQIVFNKDINENIINEKYILPDKNLNVRLTIDKNIQDRMKEVLNSENYKRFNQVGVVLMESDTGKIRGFVQKDDTQPNVCLGAATDHGYEPGSIFKIIVEEAGLDRKSFSLAETFTCKLDSSSLCKKEHGTLNAEQAIIQSCNNVFAQLGERIGFNNVLDNAKSQGLFTDDKILGMDAEEKGLYIEPNPAEGGARLVSIGQNMKITPIQSLGIVNTVINKGIYVKPYVVEGYVDDKNNMVEEAATEEHYAVKENTAALLRNQLREVVQSGTGMEASIKNIDMGGKTGSTTRMDGKKAVSDGWFIGFFKVGDRYYSMVVFVKEIDKEKEGGGNTAAPIFRDIAKEVINYYSE